MSSVGLPSGGYPSAVSAGSQALFVGAQSVDVYDSATASWSTMALSAARYQPSVVTLGTLVLIAGGGGEGGATVDIYDPAATASPPDNDPQ